jgi:hypothetical protein
MSVNFKSKRLETLIRKLSKETRGAWIKNSDNCGFQEIVWAYQNKELTESDVLEWITTIQKKRKDFPPIEKIPEIWQQCSGRGESWKREKEISRNCWKLHMEMCQTDFYRAEKQNRDSWDYCLEAFLLEFQQERLAMIANGYNNWGNGELEEFFFECLYEYLEIEWNQFFQEWEIKREQEGRTLF